MQPGDVPVTYADTTPLEQDFGFKPAPPARRPPAVCGMVPGVSGGNAIKSTHFTIVARTYQHNMEIIRTELEGVLIIEPRVFKDGRGYFFESFSQREFDEKVTPILGHSINFVQDNESMSSYGVMRGLHYQRMPYTQSKLVRCVKGAVLDVAVDIRKGSPTFGQHVSCLLTGRDEEGMKIAEQFAKESVIINQSSVIIHQ